MGKWTRAGQAVRAMANLPAPAAPASNVMPLRPDMAEPVPERATMHFKLPVYESLTDKQPSRYVEGDGRAVLEALAQVLEVDTKPDAPAFGVALLRDDLQPGQSTTVVAAHAGTQAVALDVDGATPSQIEAFDAALRAWGWLHIKYATYNHTPGAQRFRYAILLARVVESRHYTAQIWEPLNVLSGGMCDPQAKDSGRRSFFPSCPRGQGSAWPAPEIHGDRFLDPDELTALVPKSEVHTGGADAKAPADERGDRRDRDPGLIAAGCSMFAKFLEDGDPDNGNGDTLWRLAAGITHYVQDGERLFHTASAKDPRYDRREAQAKRDGYKAAGPPLCMTVNASGHAGCATCPSWGKISTPVELGDSLEVAAPDAGMNVQQALTAGGICTIMDQYGWINYVTEYERDGRVCREVAQAQSEAATDRLIHAATAVGGKAPSPRAIEVAEAQFRVKARQAGNVTRVHVRFAEHDGTYLHDLGPGRIGCISAEGYRVTEETADTPLFRRGVGAAELPNPDFKGTAREALACLVHTFKDGGCDAGEAILSIVWALNALRP